MANTLDVKVPDIGDYQGVPVIEVLVKDGDAIEKDAPLAVLESDKATMEVPSPAAGTVRGLKLKAGDKVSQGDLICQLETAADVVAPAVAAAAAKTPPPQPSPASGGGSKAAAGGEAPAEPAAAAAKTPPPQPSPAGGGVSKRAAAGLVEVRVPDIGDYTGVPVIELLVKDGDAIEKDAPLVVLESDKATMEVPAPAAGIVRGIKLKAGDKVSQGDVICALETAAGGETAAETAAAKTPPPQPSPASGGGSASAPADSPVVPDAAAPARADAGATPYAGPATRKFARQLGVDLSKVKASGPRGRIVIEDVQAFVKGHLGGASGSAARGASGGAGIPPVPAQDFSKYGAIEVKPLARIRKLSAAHLHRAWLNVPHVTQQDAADITELEAFRKSQSQDSGVKLTLLPFVMKAVGVALRQFPEFNASLAADGEALVLKQYCNIGFAADTENGLVVPVVKDVWSKGVVQLASECAALAQKARDGKLAAEDMKGGCFSISSLGGIGGTHFTPIVNAPEVAILGVSRAQLQPVWNGSEFAPRLLCPLSLSYDHRVIDGAAAARFIVALGKLLLDVRLILL